MVESSAHYGIACVIQNPRPRRTANGDGRKCRRRSFVRLLACSLFVVSLRRCVAAPSVRPLVRPSPPQNVFGCLFCSCCLLLLSCRVIVRGVLALLASTRVLGKQRPQKGRRRQIESRSVLVGWLTVVLVVVVCCCVAVLCMLRQEDHDAMLKAGDDWKLKTLTVCANGHFSKRSRHGSLSSVAIKSIQLSDAP